MGKKVVWYEKGTNAVKQVLYESNTDDIDIKQLNNILLIRDGNTIAKCIFDEFADNGQGRYKTAIADLPALPIMSITTEKKIVEDGDDIAMWLDWTSSTIKQYNEAIVDHDIASQFKYLNLFRDYNYYLNYRGAFPEGADHCEMRTNLLYRGEQLEELKNTIWGKYKLLAGKEKKYYAGYVFISYAFELYDGSITKPAPMKMLRLGDNYDRDFFYIHHMDTDKRNGVQVRGFLSTIGTPEQGKLRVFKNRMHVEKISVKFSSLNYDEDIIKGIVIFCSAPIPIYDFENLKPERLHFSITTPYAGNDNDAERRQIDYDRTSYVIDGNESNFDIAMMSVYYGVYGRYNLTMDENKEEGLKQIELTEKILSNIILYRVEKFNVNASSSELTKDLDLTGIETNENMVADASGWWNTGGEMFVYNQRLHLFNYIQKFHLDGNNVLVDYMEYIRSLGTGFNYLLVPFSILVYIKVNNKDLVINLGKKTLRINTVVPRKLSLPKYISFPDIRAYRMDFLYHNTSMGEYWHGTIRLVPSDVLNFAYTPSITDNVGVNIIDLAEIDLSEYSHYLGLTELSYSDNTSIMVSEINNPFYFPVSQSYQGGAPIIQLAVAHEEITSSQVGQFPLYVFTSERIFALGTGSGNVLYGNLTPISAEVCINRNVLQTKYGILFAARSGLKIISGREITDISDVIERDVDMDVRKQDGMPNPPYMQALSNSALVNLYGRLSAVIFEDYIKDAVFGYDINRNEITVSNRAYEYSYVFELDNRVWHKTSEVFEHFSGNTCLMKLNANNRRHVTDIRVETGKSAEVLLQTRPLVISDYDFKAVRRFAVRGEVKPAAGRLFGFYGLGSNNLKDYRMTAGVQTGNYFGVLLTQKAGKWNRYYVLMCAGEISMDSNISHFEAEFTDKINGRLR
jgi:hypothetical protein